MKKEHILILLPHINSDPSAVFRPGWVIARCPFAPWLHEGGIDRDPSFAISVRDSGESRFNCFSCNRRGWLGDLVPMLTRMCPREERPPGYDLKTAYGVIVNEETAELYGGDIQEYDRQFTLREHDRVFPDDWLESFLPAIHSHPARNYLEGRGLTPRTIRRFDIRYDSAQDRVCFPIRNWKNELVGLHGRLLRPQRHEFEPVYRMYTFMQDKNVLPWFGEHIVDPQKRVVITESVFDLTSVWRVYRHVIAPLSAGIGKNKIERIKRCEHVITLFDNGKGGDSAREQMDKYFLGKKMRHLKPPEGVDDAGEMTLDQLRSTLSPHITVQIV